MDILTYLSVNMKIVMTIKKNLINSSFFEQFIIPRGDNMENNLTFFDVGILNEAIYTLTTSDMEYKFKEAETMIKEAKRVFLIRHLSPDKDAFGAVNSLAAEIKYRYKTKEVRLIQEKTVFDGDFTEDDLVIFLDVSSYGRLGISKNNLDYFKITGNKFKSIRIDHHSTNDMDPISSTLDIVDEKAGSTCELVTLFLKENDYPINKEIAELLFTGIISDTGRLQYSMSKTTLLAMAILSDAGVDHTEVYNKMYMKSPTMIKGKKFILDNYKISTNGVAYLLVDDNMAKQHGFDKGETASMVHELEGIKGSPIWIIGNYSKDGITCRVRSRGINIIPICSKYGGGGHKNACGVKVSGKQMFARLVADLDDYLNKVKTKD